MTIKDIAKMAGVSISTVSKIVNNKDENINIETRNRVLKLVKDYNYTPYSAAKSTSEAKTFILGVLLKSTSQTNLFVSGVLSSAQKNGYSILLYDNGGDVLTELKNITSLCKNNVDGVIWEPVGPESLKNKYHFEQQGIRICFLDTPDQPSSFSMDYTQIGYEATSQLIKHGHTQLGFLTPENTPQSNLTLAGFKKCLFDNGISFSDAMLLSRETDQWYLRLLSHTPTGIVSTHYASSLSLMKQLSQIKYRVPYDVSLITLREDGQDSLPYPEISSIKIPHYEFGTFVCNSLVEACEKTKNPDNIFLTTYPLENTETLSVPFSSHNSRILVVGSINIDITLNVDELPQSGRTVSTNRHSVILGGKGANQAVGAAKLGSEVALIGKVGNDYDSTLVYAGMEEHRVDIQGIRRDGQAETGKAYIHVQNDGENMITILSGANETLSPEDILSYEKLFENASYCLLQTEVPEAAIQKAARLAKKYHVKTILKPAAMNRISPSLMKLIDIFVPNRKEAELLCPHVSDIKEKAEEFAKNGIETVIITLGHSGCYIKSPSFNGYLPAASFTPVDTTGAADAFISALAVYLSLGCSLESAAKIATYAAGFCISRQGVIPALIDKNSLEAYIKRIEFGLL